MDNQPPDDRLTSAEPYRSNSGRALAVTLLLFAYIGVTLLFILFSFLQINLLSEAAAGVEISEDAATFNDLRIGLAAMLVFAVYLATIVAFSMWVHRAYMNLRALGNPDKYLNYSPRWAVGSFFIPLANLVLPYIIVKEIWDRSDPNVRTQDDLMFTPTGGSPLLLAWWIVWVASNALSNVSFRLMDENAPPGEMIWMTQFGIVSDVVGIIAALLAILIVRSITSRQEERSRHVTYIPLTPPPPPVFSTPPPHSHPMNG